MSGSQPSGAKPQPKSCAAARSKPRWARNSRASRAPGRAELPGVELGGGRVRGDQALLLPLLLGPDRRRARPRRTAAGCRRGPASRSTDSTNVEVVDVHQERDRVAALAAAVAEEDVAARRDGERRGLLVVERAQALEVAAARGLERHVVGDDVGDRGPLAHQRDVFVADPACHALPSPCPPPSCTAVRILVGVGVCGFTTIPSRGRDRRGVGHVPCVSHHRSPLAVRRRGLDARLYRACLRNATRTSARWRMYGRPIAYVRHFGGRRGTPISARWPLSPPRGRTKLLVKRWDRRRRKRRRRCLD